MQTNKRLPLGQILVDQEIISQAQLDLALKKQNETGELLGTILINLGFVDDELVFYPILAAQLGVDFISLKHREIPEEIVRKIPPRFAVKLKVIPVGVEGDVLTIATEHPHDINVIDGVRMAVSSKIRTVLATQKDIMESIRKYYGVGADTIEEMMGSVTGGSSQEEDSGDIDEIDSEASIAKFINQILLEAYRDRATDIHIEPFEQDLKVRYRVDGVLIDAQVPENIWHFKDSINSRIKIMSNLNIAEKRLPQDGRFKVRVKDIDLDLRVSFLPTPYGESLVIRILSSSKLYSMKDLGLKPEHLLILRNLIKKPHGIIFVTGPTGSGKTTTLYSCLSHLNAPERKIITIEDPIEYQLKGVTQIQINAAVGLTFATGLRSMLRHDPDVMMVGEVRDKETAEIAVQVAMTGHLVFSTLHTNDAAGGVSRLLDMGIEPFLISSSVECFIAQRLIRLLCSKCKKPIKINEEIASEMGFDYAKVKEHQIFENQGCEDCKGTGFMGREGIYEFLPLTDEIRDLILARASAVQIRNKAVAAGMKTLLECGWDKVREGLTTPSEVIRVTKEEMD